MTYTESYVIFIGGNEISGNRGLQKKSIIKDRDENSIELFWWILESGYNLDR